MWGSQVVSTSNPNQDVALQNPPGDTVSQIVFSPAGHPGFAVSSWDKKVRCYSYGQDGSNQMKCEIAHEAPALCCDFSNDGARVFSGGCDNKGICWDLASNKPMPVASHDQPINFIHWISAANILMTGSWDSTIRYWDGKQQAPVATVNIDAPLACADVQGALGVAVAGSKTFLFDLNNPTNRNPIDTVLKYQPRTVKVFPDQKGYAIGSIEGRVSVQYFDRTLTSKNFTFKCHRDGVNVHAINSIAFHPNSVAFATGGSDCNLHFWDKDQKTRVKQFKTMEHPITATAFGSNGGLFAYATGYDWGRQNTTQVSNGLTYSFMKSSQVKLRAKRDKEALLKKNKL